MMGSEKDTVLEKFDQYFVIVGVFFFVFTKMKLFGGLICFCSASYSSQNHKGLGAGRAAIPAVCRISECPPHATPSGQKSQWKLGWMVGCRELTEP